MCHYGCAQVAAICDTMAPTTFKTCTGKTHACLQATSSHLPLFGAARLLFPDRRCRRRQCLSRHHTTLPHRAAFHTLCDGRTRLLHIAAIFSCALDCAQTGCVFGRRYPMCGRGATIAQNGRGRKGGRTSPPFLLAFAYPVLLCWAKHGSSIQRRRRCTTAVRLQLLLPGMRFYCYHT